MSQHQRPSDQRTALCDALAAVAPTAPTLCEGWTAHHLAAHVWVRENEPVGAAGIAVPALARRTAERLEEVRSQRAYTDLIDAIRRGPGGLSPFRLPGVEAAANTVEFFVHCEDVRRGAGDLTPRPRDAALENFAWRRAATLARLLLRRSPVAVWLERDLPPGEPVRIGRGPDIVTLSGPPSEILLYLFGRRSAANLEVFGEPAAVAAMTRAATPV
ncbi:MAG: TIGR03085 family protein [Propionibacteriaceae bacterium]|nr:TIGR03085 family protein [Propionibacteriaceae bacterium]